MAEQNGRDVRRQGAPRGPKPYRVAAETAHDLLLQPSPTAAQERSPARPPYELVLLGHRCRRTLARRLYRTKWA